MNSWARKSFNVGVLSAGALLFAGTAANAATLTSIGNSGVGSGNQTNTITQAPIDICGNAVGAAGNSSAGCFGGSWANLGADNTVLTSFGNSGAGSGNQINTVTQAPVDVCGNAIGAAGNTWAHCIGGSFANYNVGSTPVYGAAAFKPAKQVHQRSTESAHITEAGTTLTSVGNSGAGSGNQANSIIQIPIDVCGNAVGGLGNAQASCVGGASATSAGTDPTSMFSGFNAGVASGNQINSILQVPINVCGNAIGAGGNTSASCVGGSDATIGGGGNGGGGNGGGGYGGYASGNYTGGGTPGTATNENIAASKSMGFHHVLATPNHIAPHDATGKTTTLTSVGNSGIGSGNQVNSTIQIPIEISGNAIGAGGNAWAQSLGGSWANN